ncbi:hypothetical protein N431DRAFT_436198 [Stipitochalara longipes BDJ]|nr:hypothetical protein N431DRAFT_436198 [Stipitochalara longipes BDJ]
MPLTPLSLPLPLLPSLWRGEPNRCWNPWIEIFQPISPAPSFAQRRGDLKRGMPAPAPMQILSQRHRRAPSKLLQNLLCLSLAAVLTLNTE